MTFESRKSLTGSNPFLHDLQWSLKGHRTLCFLLPRRMLPLHVRSQGFQSNAPAQNMDKFPQIQVVCRAAWENIIQEYEFGWKQVSNYQYLYWKIIFEFIHLIRQIQEVFLFLFEVCLTLLFYRSVLSLIQDFRQHGFCLSVPLFSWR